MRERFPGSLVRFVGFCDKSDLFFRRSSDINFSSHLEFSRKYQLGGEDETAVRQLFHPEVLEFFESQGRGVSVEAVSYTHLTLPTIYSV